jgi:hypothetical protein
VADEAVCGPIDFLLISFDEASNDGSAGAELLDLVERGVIALYDLRVIRRTDDGYDLIDISMMPNGAATGLAAFVGAVSGLLTDDDFAQAAALLEPGRAAALIVYENAWARRFIGAALRADAEVLAAERIPAETVIEVLDFLDATA